MDAGKPQDDAVDGLEAPPPLNTLTDRTTPAHQPSGERPALGGGNPNPFDSQQLAVGCLLALIGSCVLSLLTALVLINLGAPRLLIWGCSLVMLVLPTLWALSRSSGAKPLPWAMGATRQVLGRGLRKALPFFEYPLVRWLIGAFDVGVAVGLSFYLMTRNPAIQKELKEANLEWLSGFTLPVGLIAIAVAWPHGRSFIGKLCALVVESVGSTKDLNAHTGVMSRSLAAEVVHNAFECGSRGMSPMEASYQIDGQLTYHLASTFRAMSRGRGEGLRVSIFTWTGGTEFILTAWAPKENRPKTSPEYLSAQPRSTLVLAAFGNEIIVVSDIALEMQKPIAMRRYVPGSNASEDRGSLICCPVTTAQGVVYAVISIKSPERGEFLAEMADEYRKMIETAANIAAAATIPLYHLHNERTGNEIG